MQAAPGAARDTRPSRSTSPCSYAGVLEVRFERLVRAVREHDEVGRLVAHLLGEVVLVPAQRGEDLRAVDPQRVDHDAGLRAIERHAEDADLAVADGANARPGAARRRRRTRRTPTRLRRARRDAAGVRAVDDHVEAAAAGLLPVVDLDAREARRDLGPGARPRGLGARCRRRAARSSRLRPSCGSLRRVFSGSNSSVM